jgi:hypothetical protein
MSTRFRIQVDGKFTGGEWLSFFDAADYCKRQVLNGSCTVIECDEYSNPILREKSDVELVSRAILTCYANKIDMPEAARAIRRAMPNRVLKALEIIGSWPSSEPELRALQQT